MKNLIKRIFKLTLPVLIFTSCAALRVADIRKLSIGMDKESVIATLNSKPDIMVGARKYPGGTMEVVGYAQGMDAAGHVDYKWLYFYNNKLLQISGPGNWQRDADLLVADNEHPNGE